MSKKKNNSATWIVVLALLGGLAFVGIFVIGILAAIAIPSFIMYVNKSKATEAEVVLRQMQNGVEAYHLANCKFPSVLAPTSEMPNGGNSVPVDTSGAFWTEVGTTPPDPSHFRYRTVPTQSGLVMLAEADFKIGAPVHTYSIELSRTGECSIAASPIQRLNEFE